MRLVLAAALGLGALAAVPAAHAGANLTCVSLDLACQGYTCPDDSVEVFNNGFNDTGPWVVICRPIV